METNPESTRQKREIPGLRKAIQWARTKNKYVLIPVLAVLSFIVLMGVVGFWVVFAPNTELYTGKRGVKIPRGSNFSTAIDSLDASGVLGSRATLKLLGTVTGWGGQVKAGYYEFPTGVSNYSILNKIRKGLQDPIKVMIPPGTRPEVIAAVAAKQMAFKPQEMLEALQDTSLARDLGTDPAHLFGYMMPETYSFYWLTGPRTVVKKVKQSFDSFYERELAAKASAMGLSKGDVVALASIVEWETGVPAERPRVSGVYLNRIRIGMPLQADPSVQFIVMKKEGKKRRLLHEDLKIDSPYNTYRYAGLPPGPITNPSPSALRAAVNPERHDFLYFVAKGDGTHTFSRSYTEHLIAAREYYALMQKRRKEVRSTP